jgi:predicted GIY-YIG superfamily endonuclease
VTSNRVKRAWEHKHHVVEGFTTTHGIHNRVWHELHETMESAIRGEKAIRKRCDRYTRKRICPEADRNHEVGASDGESEQVSCACVHIMDN